MDADDLAALGSLVRSAAAFKARAETDGPSAASASARRRVFEAAATWWAGYSGATIDALVAVALRLA